MPFQLVPPLQLHWRRSRNRRNSQCHECMMSYEAGEEMMVYEYEGKYGSVSVRVCAGTPVCAAGYEKKWFDSKFKQ